MEKNKLPLRFIRIALMITLTFWALMLALGPFILFIAPIVFIYIMPTILIMVISYEKRYEDNNVIIMILLTLFSYIGFGGITISMAPDLAEIIYILFIPQTICLTLACLTFKKINERSFIMKNNTLPLVLTRISLGITLLYIGALFILFTPSSSDPSEGDGIGMMIAFLFPAFSYISNCYYIKYYYFN